MKKHLFDLLKKKPAKAESEKKGGEGVDTLFSRGIDLSQSFEDMFPGEIPDEIHYYDIHGNEVEE